MIESLEPRIAPASVSITGNSAQWVDSDGDIIKMTWSKGPAPTFDTMNRGLGLLVKSVTLDAAHTGAKFAITPKAAGGDGRVELGVLDGKGIAIGGLNAPRAGFVEIDYGVSGQSIGEFTIGGLGHFSSNAFYLLIGDGKSGISGNPSKIKVMGDIGYGTLEFSAPGAKIAEVLVKGSLRGTAFYGETSAFLSIGAASVGKITIGSSVIGGREYGSGRLFVSAEVGSVTIGGSVIGGIETLTGNVQIAGKLGSLTLGGSIIGGDAGGAGKVLVTNATKVTIGGSIVGGLKGDTGFLNAVSIGSLLVKGDVGGGGTVDATSDSFAGGIRVTNNVGTLTVLGGLYAGREVSGPELTLNGCIGVGGTVGKLSLGSIHGNSQKFAMVLVGATATPSNPGDFNVIGSVNIKGSMEFGLISSGQLATPAGFNQFSENPDAGIGPVTIGGNFQHSSILAGIGDFDHLGAGFNDARDLGDPNRLARLGPVVIKGAITNGYAGTRTFGIEAEKIASVTTGGAVVFKTGDPLRYFDNTYTLVREF